MKFANINGASGITPPKHFGMTTFRLLADEPGTDNGLGMSISYYLPGGGAEKGTAPVEMIYFVLEGEIVVESEEQKYVLKKGDAIHMGIGDSRSVKNESEYPASILIIGYAKMK